jgi:RNA polymerase sigma-70 factor, ECF subfamily
VRVSTPAAVDRSAVAPTPDFPAIYDAWFDEVLRWLPAMGVPDADLEDLAQEVFIVVRRKIAEFRGENLSAWLYGICLRTASDHRRRAWFRNLFMRPRDVDLDQVPDHARSPLDLLERREAQHVVAHLLARMSDKRRRAFVLYEIEGYSGEEIAALEQIPLATVWTRLHHARKDFVALAARLRKQEELP